MRELACPDIDGRVLVLMSVKVEPELRSDALRVDGGRYSRLPFAQHEQHALINIVVNEYKRLSGRLDKIRSEFIGIEDLAVEEDASTGEGMCGQRNRLYLLALPVAGHGQSALNPFYSPVG